ncbi:SAM-dependent methyltransferase [Dichotomicrobium thermohalophilum]|uniref:Cyclopropane-fatty-acyl-phospholipid synthase n=1 Tax=Dichotomicrobium thermohalophilum TaxID=933063 RepID=A0A397PFT6_9HYPH|nr:cyclopropane-fatty-acyl-phospholipid synthase family protein [Dichotomicrobium thermohalophilum]RIA47323.1 cyclopropane-fatty-acyl-phospholipid synthase [Dichotomicrobium thermohalophilum]
MKAQAQDRQVAAARGLVAHLADHLDLDASVRLWDGTLLPLGRDPRGPLTISIAAPGVIASLLRWPTLDRLIRHYAAGDIELESGSLIDLGHQLEEGGRRKSLKGVSKRRVAAALLSFLLTRAQPPGDARAFAGDADGSGRAQAQNRDFVQFHYDVGNDFYRLFLDERMQYSCAYFTDPANSLDQAQTDKLEMICRKLRLEPGDRVLDIGCGWGGLICYAAEHYGVTAHGITLSPAQLEVAKARIAAQGLSERVTVGLTDYVDISGTYDKVVSVGMYEHIGLANIDKYMRAVRRVLAPDGLFLNHAISRRSKRNRRRFGARAEQRALKRYIFPGGELDDIGHTVQAMEQAGFEVHDVEGWRRHYARTTRLWCERLMARREEAEALVGAPTYRIWTAYLAGCSLAFERGSARIFQTLASRSARGDPPLPPTRADLYR